MVSDRGEVYLVRFRNLRKYFRTSNIGQKEEEEGVKEDLQAQAQVEHVGHSRFLAELPQIFDPNSVKAGVEYLSMEKMKRTA